MESYFQKHDRFRAVVIFSTPGVDYLYAVHPSYLSVFPDNNTLSVLEGDTNIILDSNTFFESDFTAPLQIPKHEDIIISSIYNIVTRGEFYQVLRDSGIAFAVLVLIVVVFLIVTPKKKSVQRGPSPTGSNPVEEAPSVDTFVETSVDASVDASTEIPKKKPKVKNTPTETNQNGSKGLFSPHSGLGWEAYLENRLNFELRRAASFDQDLVLILFTSPQLRKENPIYRKAAESIVDYFTFQDLTFEFKDNGFSIILPNTELDEAIKKMEFFLKKLSSLDFESTPMFSVGLSSRNGRLLSAQRLIHEATKAIEKAQSYKKTKIVGFRSDPVKYRKYIASKM
jgi:GGDEF domain-containing protein